MWAAPHWRAHGVSIEQHWLAREVAGDWHFAADRVRPYRDGARRFDAGGVVDPLRLAMADAALRQIAAWGVATIAGQLRARTAAFAQALDEQGLASWRTVGPVAHFIGLRPADAASLQAVTAALSAAGVVATSRHGIVRIAPHLHVGVDDMRQVAGIIGDAARRGC